MDRGEDDFKSGSEERHGVSLAATLVRQEIRLTLETVANGVFVDRCSNDTAQL